MRIYRQAVTIATSLLALGSVAIAAPLPDEQGATPASNGSPARKSKKPRATAGSVAAHGGSSFDDVLDLPGLSDSQRLALLKIVQEFKMSSKSLRRELKANKAQLRQMRGNHQPQEAGTVIGGAIMAGLASVEPGKQVAGRRQRPGADETAEERRRHHVLKARILDVKQELAELRSAAWKQILPILTPEQRESLKPD
ncbi:MAG: hypothetical protein IPM23_06515 [Candidatus Melainabacteria bacterium]|nr:hypothetical protein [Candidatus Melainabacteria bacterium]